MPGQPCGKDALYLTGRAGSASCGEVWSRAVDAPATFSGNIFCPSVQETRIGCLPAPTPPARRPRAATGCPIHRLQGMLKYRKLLHGCTKRSRKRDALYDFSNISCTATGRLSVSQNRRRSNSWDLSISEILTMYDVSGRAAGQQKKSRTPQTRFDAVTRRTNSFANGGHPRILTANADSLLI